MKMCTSNKVWCVCNMNKLNNKIKKAQEKTKQNEICNEKDRQNYEWKSGIREKCFWKIRDHNKN